MQYADARLAQIHKIMAENPDHPDIADLLVEEADLVDEIESGCSYGDPFY